MGENLYNASSPGPDGAYLCNETSGTKFVAIRYGHRVVVVVVAGP